MKNKQVRILNGDALKELFPKNMDGEIIVARECLMVGNLEGEDLAEFFKNRARFIVENYAVSEKTLLLKYRKGILQTRSHLRIR